MENLKLKLFSGHHFMTSCGLDTDCSIGEIEGAYVYVHAYEFYVLTVLKYIALEWNR